MDTKRYEGHRYLHNIIASRPYIIIYHRAGLSKLKQCSDIDHFHMITWHFTHPTSEHSFNGLKKAMGNRAVHPYVVTYPKVYNPYGLANYFEKETHKREVIAANRVTTEGMKLFFGKVTDKKLMTEIANEQDECKDISNKGDTLQGQKYDFIIKIMKKCKSTDIADIMIYCKNTKNQKIRTWEPTFRNTTQPNNIIQAAATDINVETKVQPIWQIRQKKDYFSMNKNRYWDVQNRKRRRTRWSPVQKHR